MLLNPSCFGPWRAIIQESEQSQTHVHTCIHTSVRIQCEVIYDSTGVRDVNFMFSKVEVYTYLYSLAKSMKTVFPWLYKFTSMPFGYVCVQISRALKLLHIQYTCYGLGITSSSALWITLLGCRFLKTHA